ncbi:cold shock domain-containing protein [Candidatus Parcubacteria bacterium]|nr:cold shock domain-containing protein [Candidatus Parcubacteria bacterium]
MSTGTIKKIVEGKPFGFITPDDQQPGDKDVFFHQESLVGISLDELREGDKVSFDIEASDKGPKASNVKKS